MMYIETPGAPSRTITSDGGNSADFRALPSFVRLSVPSSANSLTFFKNWTSCSRSLITADIDFFLVLDGRHPWTLSPRLRVWLVSHREPAEVKDGNSGPN